MTGTRELGAEAAVRDDAGRDVARLWATEDSRPGGPSDALAEALDRLAAAYGIEP